MWIKTNNCASSVALLLREVVRGITYGTTRLEITAFVQKYCKQYKQINDMCVCLSICVCCTYTMLLVTRLAFNIRSFFVFFVIF